MERENPPGKHLAERLPSVEADDGVIADEMQRALERNQPIGKAGAMAIARHLVHRYGAATHPALQQYVTTGYTPNSVVRGEYLALIANDDVTADDKELAAWLGDSIIDAETYVDNPRPRIPGAPNLSQILWSTTIGDTKDEFDLWVRAGITEEGIAELPQRLHPYVSRYGMAFKAFLSLPDVDAASENLEESFNETYVGSFPLDRTQVLEQTTDYAEMVEAVRKAAADYAYQDAVTVDIDTAWQLVAENLYDLVEAYGQFHVFHK
jgi:hypothetical protein